MCLTYKTVKINIFVKRFCCNIFVESVQHILIFLFFFYKIKQLPGITCSIFLTNTCESHNFPHSIGIATSVKCKIIEQNINIEVCEVTETY